jgi:copper transport protein
LLYSKYPAVGAHHIAWAVAGASGVSRARPGAVPASVPMSTPTLWVTGAARWLLLAGLALALGGLAGRGLARQYIGREDTPVVPAPLPPPWALRGSLMGLAASAALLIIARADPGVTARLALPPVVGLESRATGVIAAVEFACFALAALTLRLRQPGWSLPPLFAVALAEGIRAHPEGSLPVAGALLTVCHLLPGVVWAGMLVYTARAAIAWCAYPRAVQGLVKLHSTAAAWLFAVVVVTGVLSALLLVPVGSLVTTAYGRVLLAKAALVAVAAVLALVSRVRLRRPAEPGAGIPLVTRLEIGALAAVLAAAGLLTVLAPPAKPIFPGRARSASAPAVRASRRQPGEAVSLRGSRAVPRTVTRPGPAPGPGGV